jgi:N-methylhydantoinase A
MIIIGVDTGGTFTDVAVVESASGKLWISKVSSTPTDPSQAFFDGIESALEVAEAKSDVVALVSHGTTVATNAIIEGKGASAALITTAGFRYVLDIGRHDVPRGAGLYLWEKPERPITPDQVFEVTERLDPLGNVLIPLNEANVRAVAAQIREAGAKAVGVCTLFSYINENHERRIAEILAEELPNVPVSLSCDVLPEFREYERAMLTALNASVMPLMSGYIRRVREGLDSRGIASPFTIMKSNGGVSSAHTIAQTPIYTAMSGLAAGVLGACFVGRSSNFKDLISLDIGGTSTDVAICPNATPTLTADFEIGSFPIKSPSVDVRTIGAGGGSIAAILANGSLTVGPASAGADPGPVCYGRGGFQPTVTDAQIALGRLPESLAGGKLILNAELARDAIKNTIADRLSLSMEQAANGIIEILTHNIAGAVREVSIERGYDPTDYALIAFGGAGPLHAIRLAEVLDMRTVVFPRYPGVLSALGLLGTPLRQDYVATVRQSGPSYDFAALTKAFEGIETSAHRWFDSERMSGELRQIERFIDVRYPHQGSELQIALNPKIPIGPESLEEVEAAFHKQHKQLYGYAMEESPVQLVNVRLAAIGKLPPLALPRAPSNKQEIASSGSRRVYIDDASGYVVCQAVNRDTLNVGAVVIGPALIDQLDTTVFIRPEWTAKVDDDGNLVAIRDEEVLQ